MLVFFKENFLFRGALTSKPYSFLARPWEFRSVDSIDVFDSLASNIRIDVRGDKILRILPRTNDLINDDWISDKIRFVCDAIRLQRIDNPLLTFNNSYFLLNWTQVFNFWSFNFFYSSKFFNKNLKHLGLGYNNFLAPAFLLGRFLDLESAFVLNCINKSFFFNLNSVSELLKNKGSVNRSNFLFNSSLSELSSYSSIFLVDCNPKIDSPVLFIRMRLLSKAGVKFYSFGKCSSAVGSFVTNLGSISSFFNLLKGNHWLSSRLIRTKNFFLLDENLTFNSLFLNSFNKLQINFGFFSNSLSSLNSKESLLKVNYNFDRLSSSVNVLTNLSSNFSSDFSFRKDSNELALTSLKVGLFSHGGLNANLLDLLIPVSSPFESSKAYLNCLGLIQKTRLALVSPNNVLDCSDSLVFYYLFLLRDSLKYKKNLNINLFYIKFFYFFNEIVLNSNKVWEYINFFFELVESESTFIPFSNLIKYFYQVESNFKNLKTNASEVVENNSLKLFSMPIKIFNSGSLGSRLITDLNFYQNDEISLVSSTLGAASKRLIDKRSFF